MFRLNLLQGDVPVRQHLEQVEEATGREVPELHPEPPPAALEHVWRWFGELHRSRRSGFGVEPITYSDIHSWVLLTSNRPSPAEIDILRRLDDLYIKIRSEEKPVDRHRDSGVQGRHKRSPRG